ncbi:MAG: ATP-binding protein [Bacteroidales bacterium]
MTFTDITHRKRAENEINQLNASLELKVRQRTADLETAIREMEAFSYSVSHDLRAPLRAIGGYSKFLSDEFGTLLNDEGRRFIKVIRDNVTRMDQLISDLLQLSRINTGQFHFSNVSMEEVVQEVITDVLPAVDRNRFRIHVDPLPAVKGNENLLRQVWLNYIGNAVKYSSRSEKKDIVIGAEVQGDEHIFWIRDQGVGFNPLYKDKLFGIFQRLHTQEEFEGTGVGLALVQRIIHRHKGRVWAEGKPNQGATFYFTLPKHANNEGKSG